jgi:predicted transposase YbfD/YdcC
MIVVQSSRQVNGQEKARVERHYSIIMLDRRTRARRLGASLRGPWRVADNLPWQLDVSFREAERRIRKGHGAENFSRLCRMALNMLKNEKSQKTGIAIKRQTRGWDNDYLLKVLQA